MKPWKRPSPFTSPQHIEELQWGHGDEAVEELGRPLGLAMVCSLQWGHGDEAVEEVEVGAIVNVWGAASMGPRR